MALVGRATLRLPPSPERATTAADMGGASQAPAPAPPAPARSPALPVGKSGFGAAAGDVAAPDSSSNDAARANAR